MAGTIPPLGSATQGQAPNASDPTLGAASSNSELMGGPGLFQVPTTTDELNDEMDILVRAPGDRFSSKGIPSWLIGTHKVKELRDVPKRLGTRELRQLRSRLWQAGFYGPELMLAGEQALLDDPLPTQADEEAWGEFLKATAADQNAMLQGGANPDEVRSADEMLRDEGQANQADLADATSQRLNTTGVIESLQSEMEKLLQRTVPEEEVVKIVQSALANSEKSVYEKAEIIEAGGPDSSAIEFASGLARRFGLAVIQQYTPDGQPAPNDAFHEGLGVVVTGTQANMEKFRQWAVANTGNTSVFGQVEEEFKGSLDGNRTGLILTMNDGAQRPEIDGMPVDNRMQINEFMEAMKRPGGQLAYQDWQGEDEFNRGAYGISDPIWQLYTDKLGLDPRITSPKNQDAVMKAYSYDLYGQYGNWRDVALAIKGSEAEANDYRDGNAQGVVQENLTGAQEVMERLAARRQRNGEDQYADPYSRMFDENGGINLDADYLLTGPGRLRDSGDLAYAASRQFRKDYDLEIQSANIADMILQGMKYLDRRTLEAPKGPSI